MRGLQPEQMSVSQARTMVELMSRCNGTIPSRDISHWTKSRCIRWLSDEGVFKQGIGDFCRNLLRVVIGKTEDNFPVGLSYAAMVRFVKIYYPNSVADEKHLRWYANAMRACGEMIPVYRERSRWKNRQKI